ncbi:hypothetical protein [Moorena sp. SIO3B2]|uniref:hypothetical protein n=1 Tax=Moorena sp. SIO3B2 TaxID=2607827 RepID=UPI0013CAACEE|nr:hypothetical protein [Moorena sp. SIO3B2]NEP37132.1 hypothetical protein [Moorena sp. SIO3B2]NEP48310.1 hypothetical protein [Moorena sp. SIO3C2]
MNNSTSSTPKPPTLQLKDVTTLVAWAFGSTLNEFHTTGLTAVMGFWANKYKLLMERREQKR